MSYTHDRDAFIATMTREGLPLDAITALLRCATTIHRLAELACSSEAADRDRIPCPATNAPRSSRVPCLCDVGRWADTPHESIPRITLQDWQAERRAARAVPDGWRVITQGDPRGYTLRVIPPSYAARNEGRDYHNLDAIGVPARPSNIRW